MTVVLADAVVILHFAFIVFVGAGGLLALRWPRVAFIHIPAALWGAGISFGGWICPLTYLEHDLRALAGESSYDTSFIAHYLLPIIYPEGLTRGVQFAIGASVVTVNAAIYFVVARRSRHRTPGR